MNNFCDSSDCMQGNKNNPLVVSESVLSYCRDPVHMQGFHKNFPQEVISISQLHIFNTLRSKSLPKSQKWGH